MGKPEDRSDNDRRFNVLLDWLEEQVEQAEQTEQAEGAERAEDGKKTKGGEYLKQLSVPYRDRLIIVPVDRIVAAEVRDGITRLVVLDDRHGGGARSTEYIVSYKLEQLESNLDPEMFMRVHRSTIVQLECIREMISWFSGRYKLVLTGGHEVIASRERSKVLRQKMTI